MWMNLLGVCLSVCAQQTWTVDDDGPAEFSTIQAAVDMATDGDLILVEPGTYKGFSSPKALTILGRTTGGAVKVREQVSIAGADRFTLAGFDLESLSLLDIPGPALVDDVTIGTMVASQHQVAVSITDCASVEMSRATVHGRQGDYDTMLGPVGGDAVLVEGSVVSIVNCDDLTGGRGANGHPEFYSGANGGDGLKLKSGSRVTASSSSIKGGTNGVAFIFHCCSGKSGSGVTAEVLADPPVLVLRGARSDYIAAGPVDPGLDGQGKPGNSISMSSGTVIDSGVSFSGTKFFGPGVTVVDKAAPEPFLDVGGTDAPGDARLIQLHGETGLTALLLGSLNAMPATVGAVDGTLWPDLSALTFVLPVATTGVTTPLTFIVHLPLDPAFVGFTLHLQAVFLDVPGTFDAGKHFSTNPSNIVVRF